VSEKELSGRVALVTGAGRNIGRAMAKALAAGGAAVIVNVRSNKTEAEQVVAEIESDGGKAVAAIGDVADEKAVHAMVADAAKQFGSEGDPQGGSRGHRPIRCRNEIVIGLFQRMPLPQAREGK